MIYAGIDVVKDKYDCCILDDEGRKVYPIFTIFSPPGLPSRSISREDIGNSTLKSPSPSYPAFSSPICILYSTSLKRILPSTVDWHST